MRQDRELELPLIDDAVGLEAVDAPGAIDIREPAIPLDVVGGRRHQDGLHRLR